MTQAEFLSKLPESVTIKGDVVTLSIFVNGRKLSIKRSQSVHNHSREFNWGYSGSGPSQFALALLLKYVDKDTAQEYYHQLKFGWIASLPFKDFKETFNLRQIMTDILEKEKQL